MNIQQIQTDLQICVSLNRQTGEDAALVSLREKIDVIRAKSGFVDGSKYGRDYFHEINTRIKYFSNTDSERIQKSTSLIVEIYRAQGKIKEEFSETLGELAFIMWDAELSDLQDEANSAQKSMLKRISETEKSIELFNDTMIDFGMEHSWFRSASIAADIVYRGYDKETEKRIEKLQQETRAISNIAWQMELVNCAVPRDRLELHSRAIAMVKEAEEIAPPLLLETVHKVEIYAKEVIEKIGGILVDPSEKKTSSPLIQSTGSAFKVVERKK